MLKKSVLLIFIIFVLLSISVHAFNPRSVWRISNFGGLTFFDGYTHYVNHNSTENFPHEMGWEGNTVLLRFDLEEKHFIADQFELKFYVPYRNYRTTENVLLEISAGTGDNLNVIIPNLTIDHIGGFSLIINSSNFNPGTNNYIKINGTNIYPIGYGTNPPNFQWDWIALEMYGGLPSPNITDERLLEETEALGAKYFYEQSLPNCLVKDVQNTGYSSIAATGFALTIFPVMAERYGTGPYWNYTPEQLLERTNCILNTLIEIQNNQAINENLYGKEGFFFHFINPEGTRNGNSEVSTVDTAILMAGAITAGEYFGGETKEKAMYLFDNLNWAYFFNGNKKQFSHGWTPESGLIGQTWDRPSDETMLVSLLAIASEPNNTDFSESFYSWPRVERSYSNYTLVNSYFGSSFTYFFAHVWFDFRLMGYDKPPEGILSVNWWNNSIAAVKANRQFSIDNSGIYPSYGEDSWGLTACQKPNGIYEGKYGAKPSEYNGGNPYHDGTICPYGSISTMPLLRTSQTESLSSNLAFRTLRHYYNTYYWDLWGEYGPKDSFNQYGGFSKNYLGIDEGPMVAMIENYRTGLVWNYFMQNGKIKKAVLSIFEYNQPEMILGYGFGKGSNGNYNITFTLMPQPTAYISTHQNYRLLLGAPFYIP